jgi:hypothetical protein
MKPVSVLLVMLLAAFNAPTAFAGTVTMTLSPVKNACSYPVWLHPQNGGAPILIPRGGAEIISDQIVSLERRIQQQPRLYMTAVNKDFYPSSVCVVSNCKYNSVSLKCGDPAPSDGVLFFH